MPGLKPAITDILTQLSLITDDNGVTLLPVVRIWNNQPAYEREGNLYGYAKPAAFVEVVNDVQYHQLGQGVQTADIGIKVHLIHEWYDAQDGTFEDDLAVYDVRDNVVTALSYFLPSGCNELIRVSEEQDYQHDNLYHFVITFVTNLIDTAVYNARKSKYTTKQPPTDLEIDNYIAGSLVYSNTYTVARPTQTSGTSYINQTAGQTVFYLQALNGTSLSGSTVALVIKGTTPLRSNQWGWDKVNGFLTITDPAVYVDAGETLFIIYTQ